MTFLMWFLGTWFSLLLIFFTTCAIGAYINFLRERFSVPEVLNTATVKSPGLVVSVTLFYEPDSLKFHHEPQHTARSFGTRMSHDHASSRLTSYPCGI
jgi:hypothetical protein